MIDNYKTLKGPLFVKVNTPDLYKEFHAILVFHDPDDEYIFILPEKELEDDEYFFAIDTSEQLPADVKQTLIDTYGGTAQGGWVETRYADLSIPDNAEQCFGHIFNKTYTLNQLVFNLQSELI